MWFAWHSLQRSAITLVVPAIITALGLISAVSFATVDKPIRWMFHSGPGVVAIAANAEASRLLDNTRPFVIKHNEAFVPPPSWNAIPIATFQSFRALNDAFKRGELVPGVKGVLYDYEKWSFTPVDEQRNPAGYVKEAADLVHAHNLLFLTSPAVNLVAMMAPDGRSEPHETYLRLGIAADAARHADVVVIQAQRWERSTEVYTNFVRRAAAQARQANPKVMVLAGISTNPMGQRVTADDIIRAITATRDIVDGYWSNIPTRSAYSPAVNDYRPDIAIEVIRRLAGR
jgi:hypothetical protein